jgi:hypothetical protein
MEIFQTNQSKLDKIWGSDGRLLLLAKWIPEGGERYRQEMWDIIQYPESVVRWPFANEKIKMGIGLNHG